MGASQCTLKRLLVMVNWDLLVVRKQFRKYCWVIGKNSDINTFWSISSTLEFLDRIRFLDIKSVDVFDFSTLYTNLDLVLVKDALYSVIDKVLALMINFYVSGLMSLFFKKKYLYIWVLIVLTNKNLKMLLILFCLTLLYLFGGKYFNK